MTDANAAQAEYWSSAAGQTWVERETLMDALLSGVLTRVLHHAALQTGETVLDIGCGTGASSLAASGAVGASGRVTSIDIAAQLLDRARSRATEAGRNNIDFVRADAQTNAFAPGSVDVMISRFGVMFFDDPVAAFRNMAGALKPGGRMVVAAWAPAADVPWFSIPAKAAIAHLGKPEPADPDAPGPLAFQDPARVTELLKQAGLKHVRCLSEVIDVAPAGSLADIAAFATRLGPAARIMAQFSATEADVKAIEAEVGKAFAAYQTDQGLRIPARVLFYLAGPPPR